MNASASPPSSLQTRWIAFELTVLAIIAAFCLIHLPPRLLLLDTMTVGGDTPAHNYLASHLRESLLEHGRIVSWAPGWWAGFPAFQYYFLLPYLLIALLSVAIPFNIAFKLVNILGILALPSAAYVAARLMRLPRPAPILLAIAMLPVLFVRAHTMWGVNVFSTLAGMIANSHSFPIMLLAIASIYRDARDGRARWISTLLGVLMLASHFFTSIVAAITLVILPLLLPRPEKLPALRACLCTGLRTGLLMAWWLIPLLATREYSVDFGTNWNFSLGGSMPSYVFGLMPFVLIAMLSDRRAPHRPAVLLLAWLLVASGVLLFLGYDLTPVFVNVRLWPFVWFGLIALAAIGVARVVRARISQPVLVLALLAVALVQITGQENAPHDGIAPLRDWAAFNYKGLEHRPGYAHFRKLVLPLDGTPGRLANDLTEANNAMGSSRIFEAVPHLIHKPILEGGLVNSGLSSYFSYYIQCEMSSACAGYPTIVQPPSFNVGTGTRHLELFNVKHFVARSPAVQQALTALPGWRQIDASGGWQLFELETHDGRTVTIPDYWPTAVAADAWRELSLEWFDTPEMLAYPLVFHPRDRPLQPPLPAATGRAEPASISDDAFCAWVMAARGNTGNLDAWLHLGPFAYPTNAPDGLAFAPIAETGVDPQEGDQTNGRTWNLLFTRSPIFPGRFYSRTEFLVTYSFVNIWSPTARDAVLHYRNDDGVSMWLNDDLAVRDGITGLTQTRTCNVHLRAGRNRLLHKSEQSVGGHFFQVRLTDPDGRPFDDVTTGLTRQAPATPPPPPAATRPPNQGVVAELIESNRIRFTTEAVGYPHLISCSYFPNWKVRGADAIYRVTPAFMLVYPTQREVELYWGRTRADQAGMATTACGGLWALAALARWLRTRRREI